MEKTRLETIEGRSEYSKLVGEQLTEIFAGIDLFHTNIAVTVSIIGGQSKSQTVKIEQTIVDGKGSVYHVTAGESELDQAEWGMFVPDETQDDIGRKWYDLGSDGSLFDAGVVAPMEEMRRQKLLEKVVSAVEQNDNLLVTFREWKTKGEELSELISLLDDVGSIGPVSALPKYLDLSNHNLVQVASLGDEHNKSPGKIYEVVESDSRNGSVKRWVINAATGEIELFQGEEADKPRDRLQSFSYIWHLQGLLRGVRLSVEAEKRVISSKEKMAETAIKNN